MGVTILSIKWMLLKELLSNFCHKDCGSQVGNVDMGKRIPDSIFKVLEVAQLDQSIPILVFWNTK